MRIDLPLYSCILAVPAFKARDTRAFIATAAPKAEVLSLSPFRVEFSDDPSSPEALLGAFGMLRAEMEHRLSMGREIAVDCEGLRDDQVNQLRKIPPRYFTSGNRVDLTPSHMSAEFHRVHPDTDARHTRGPFDVVGDVHGCLDELMELLLKLGYNVGVWRDEANSRHYDVSHPDGRRLIFLGDLADRGPDNAGCFALAMDACASGTALCVIGNHDARALRWLTRRAEGKSNNVTDVGGFGITREQLEAETEDFRGRLYEFLTTRPSHYLLDDGDIAVAHAGVLEEMQGRDSGTLSGFCMYGAVKSELDEHGMPIRGYWAEDYHGRALVLHGHTPVQAPLWGPQGNVCCVDTGCVFGGSLTAMRWPELELVSVPAAHAYAFHPGITREDVTPSVR